MRTTMTALLVATLLTPLTPLSVSGQGEPTPRVSLHLAALRGDIDAVRQHIEAGSDLNETDAYGSTALVVAATFGQTEVARALLDAGADMGITNNDGATPLHIAAFFCHTEIVEALLDHGANRHVRDNFGNTASDTVAAPFDDVREMYDALGTALAPLGLELDYDQIRRTRPQIAELLRPRAEELQTVEYTPLLRDDWSVSTPAEQGLDPMLVAELYLSAAELETLYGLLVVKNGQLIAERYFNEGTVDQESNRQSVTKSITSALVGIALDQGCLSSVEQKMMDFFPELADQIVDPRKAQITIGDLLQMRSGYPWEEREPPYLELLYAGFDPQAPLYSSPNWHWLPRMVDFPLTRDPGTEFSYSNLTSHLLGIIVARACDTDLRSYAQEHLFSPIEVEVDSWWQDADGYNFGSAYLSLTAREMAKFGLLYLDRGEVDGNRVLSADWVAESLQTYSSGMYDNEWRSEASNYQGPYLRDVGYGYQWWSARVGEHHFSFARGHGGNLIVLLDELDMVIVTTADPLPTLVGDDAWTYEGAIINLVGRFIRALPNATPESMPSP